jgi:hypothetical protein
VRRRLPERSRLAVVVALVAFVAGASRLLFPVTIGLADQGDAHRTMCALDVRPDEAWSAPVGAYVVEQWVPYRWIGPSCGANGTGEPYRSSQLAVLRAARAVGGAVGIEGVDLRVVGLVGAAAIAVLLGAIVQVLPGPRSRALLLAAALWLALYDHGVAGYFVSGYTEPAALIGLLALAAAGLVLFRDRASSLGGLLCFASAAAVALTAQSQMVGLLPLVVVALVWQPLAPGRAAGRGRWRRRVPGALLATGLVVLSVAHLLAQPARIDEVNRHNQVFQTALVLGSTPRADLEDLGVSPTLAPLAGSSIQDDVELSGSPAYERFQRDITWGRIARLYAAHPDRLVLLVRRGVDAAASAGAPTNLGAYPERAGRAPGEHESRIAVWSLLFEVADAVPLLLAALWAAVVVFGIGLLRSHPGPEARAPAMVAVGAALAAAGQFGVVLLGDGLVELDQQLVLTRVLLMVALAFSVCAVFGARGSPPPLRLPPDLAKDAEVEPGRKGHR